MSATGSDYVSSLMFSKIDDQTVALDFDIFMYINGVEDFRKICTTSDVIYNYDSYYDDDSAHIEKFDRNNLGSGPKYYRGKVDDLIITDSFASITEVEDDYVNQPWS